MQYQYTAIDQNGHKIVGQKEADSIEAVAAELQTKLLIPLDISLVPERQSTTWLKSINKLLEEKVTLKDLQMFCRQMYTLLKAGIPITTAVSRLLETAKNKKLREALDQVLSALNQGRSLSYGMSQCPKIFTNFYVNLVKVGERSGQLDVIFQHLADYVALEIDTRNKIKSAFRYPKMVMGAIIVALLVINTFVIPAFAQLFKSFQGTLPLPTRILIATSNFIINDWPIVFGTIFFLYFGFRYWAHTANGKYRVDQLKLKIPVMGWIVYRITLARFAKLLSMVLRAGLTAVEGIELVAASTDDAYFTHKIYGISNLIERGNSITAAIEQTQLFPPLIIQMIALGEESGNIDNLLDEVAEFYQREVAYDLDRVSEAIEPILLFVVGAIVLLLALGVFLPLWDLSHQLIKKKS